MGYRGKVVEQERARALRAEGWTLAAIAAELGVARGSVSVWVRDVAVPPRAPRGARVRGPNRLQLAKAAEVEAATAAGRARIGALSERDLLIAGAALYAGEGAKGDGDVVFANSNPDMIRLHCLWLRQFFAIDESRLRVKLYLHQGLDLDAAVSFWVGVTNIPEAQFGKPYRAVADPSIRKAKHVFGCPQIAYRSTAVHRSVMGLVQALLSSPGVLPG